MLYVKGRQREVLQLLYSVLYSLFTSESVKHLYKDQHERSYVEIKVT